MLNLFNRWNTKTFKDLIKLSWFFHYLILKGKEDDKKNETGNMGTTEFVKQSVKGMIGKISFDIIWINPL